jgi:hypothetical protein
MLRHVWLSVRPLPISRASLTRLLRVVDAADEATLVK